MEISIICCLDIQIFNNVYKRTFSSMAVTMPTYKLVLYVNSQSKIIIQMDRCSIISNNRYNRYKVHIGK